MATTSTAANDADATAAASRRTRRFKLDRRMLDLFECGFKTLLPLRLHSLLFAPNFADDGLTLKR
jgi:hypothetical protein